MARLTALSFWILSMLVACHAQNLCPQYCSTGVGCATANQCNSCRSLTYAITALTQCAVCPVSQCLSCSSTDTTKCSTCREGWKLTDSSATASTQCRAQPQHCIQWTTVAIAPDAASVKDYCRTCKQSGTCNLNSMGVCTTVYTRTSKTNGGACGKCADFCLSCDIQGAGKCDQCWDGYYRESGGTCTACSANCLTCHIAGGSSCDVCDRGYDLSAGKCNKRACVEGCVCDVADSNRCDAPMTGYRFNHDLTGARRCADNCNTCQSVPPGYCDNNACKRTYIEFNNKCYSSAAYLQASLVLLLAAFLMHKLSL